MVDMVSDATRANAQPRDDDERRALEEFHEALHGGMACDTLDNSGQIFTGEVLKEVENRCNELIANPEFQALLMNL